MPLRLFIPVITVLMVSLTACTTFPTGQNRQPAPIERHDSSPQSSDILSGTEQRTGSVTLALLLPLSGQNAALGQSLLQGAQMALTDIGYNGVTLLPSDTGGTEQGAKIAAADAARNGAQIFIGPLFAEAVRGAQTVSYDANIPMLAFSTDRALAGDKTFLMGFMPEGQAQAIAEHSLRSQKMKTFAILAPNDVYGRLVAETFERTINQGGGTIARKYMLNANDPNLKNAIATLAKENLDAIFIPYGGQDIQTITAALTDQGILSGQVTRLGTGLWDDPRMMALPGLQGARFAAPAIESRKRFEDNYTAAFGTPPLRLATLSYDATALAIVLAKKGMSQNGKPDYSLNAFKNPSGFIGADGVFKFNADHIIRRDLSIMEIRQGMVEPL